MVMSTMKKTSWILILLGLALVVIPELWAMGFGLVSLAPHNWVVIFGAVLVIIGVFMRR